MTTIIVLLILTIVGTIFWTIIFDMKLPAPFDMRTCQGRDWRRSFPKASKDDIRQFLLTFTESFGFDDQDKLKFNPNDQLLDIYRALNPHKWQPDGLEFESLSDKLKSKYEVKLSDIWCEDMTLGQLFQQVWQQDIHYSRVAYKLNS